MKEAKGFTLIEVMITIIVIGIILGPLVGTLFSYYLDSVHDDRQTKLTATARAAARSLVEEMKVSGGLHATNVLSDTHAPSGGWATSSANQTLVLAIPAATTSGDFITAANGTTYYNEYIYYLQDNVLYKRVLKNTAATGNTAVTSCPPNSTAAGCPPDAQLATDVKDMGFTLYTADGTATSSPTLAHTLKLTLDFERPFGAQKITTIEHSSVLFRNKREAS